MNSPLPPCRSCGAALADTPFGKQCPACLFGMILGDVEEMPSGVRVFGEFELMEELGRGGMGVVYRAWQPRLQRMVALKMLLDGPFASAAFVERFRREALAAARLNHPAIASIYEAGEEDGQTYFTMELIEGSTLAGRLRDGLLSAKSAATLMESVARAVAHAHSQGVLHRDLKPSNILLGPGDLPKVADFGMARLFQAPGDTTALDLADLTISTSLLGSPPYMSPEQAAGHEVGAPADIYALGAVLYEILTGRPPHQGSSAVEILRHVREAAVVEPRQLNPALPRDLETICLKCLEREPSRRYETATHLADDLARFLRGEPVIARPLSTAGKVWRWCRLHPATAAAVLIAGLAVIAVSIVIGVTTVQLKKSALEAQAAGQEARQRLQESLLEQARAALLTDDSGHQFRTLDLLRQARAIAPTPAVDRLAVGALALPDLDTRLDWMGDEAGYCLPSPRGDAWTSLLTRGAVSLITVHRVPDGQELARLDNLPAAAPFERATLSPDLSLVGYVSAGRMIHVHRVSDGKEVLTCPGSALGSFSPDMTYVLVFDQPEWIGAKMSRSVISFLKRMGWNSAGDRVAELSKRSTPPASSWPRWRLRPMSLATGRPLSTWNAPQVGNLRLGSSRRAVYSPDGGSIAAVDPELDQVLVLDSLTGHIRLRVRVPFETIDLNWHPHRPVLAVSSSGHVTILNTESGVTEREWESADRGEVLGLSFSPDGRLLATSGWSTYTDLWDWENGDLVVAALKGCGHAVISADGRWLAGTAGHGMLVWPVLPSRSWRLITRRGPDRNGTSLQSTALDPSGHWMAVCDGARVEWWTSDGWRCLATIPTGPMHALAFHPKRQELIMAGDAGLQVLPWSLNGEDLVLGPAKSIWSAGGARMLALDPTGQRIACWSPSTQAPGTDRLRILQEDPAGGWSGTAQSPATYTQAGRFLSWSPDGRWISDHVWHFPAAFVWEAATGRPAYEAAGLTQSTAGPRWSPEGSLWVTGAEGQRLVIPEDWRTLEEKLLTPAFVGSLQAVGWSAPFIPAPPADPTPTTLRAFSRREETDISLHGWPDQREHFKVTPPAIAKVETLAFTPGARQLVITTSERSIWLWDLAETSRALKDTGFSWPADIKLGPAPSHPAKVRVSVLEDTTAIDQQRDRTLSKIPAVRPDTPSTCVDLTPCYNSLLDESWIVGGKKLWQVQFQALKPGLQEWDGMTFDVRGLIRLSAGDLRPFHPELPVSVRNIRVDRMARHLHFILGSVSAAETGTEIGHFGVHFADGMRSTIPLKVGGALHRSIQRTGTQPILDAASSVVWRSDTPSLPGDMVLYRHSWANPHPEQPVESLDFSSTMEVGGPMLFGLTVGE